MLEVSEEIKDLYRKGTKSKSLILDFPILGLQIGNENICYETMNVTESISEGDELTFGDCNAAEFKITLADIAWDLNGQIFTVTQILDNNPSYAMPLGTYTVKSCKRQSDRRFKDIVAYDDMIKLDRDVVAWYNSRQFPVTLKALRESLLVYCGIAYESQDLPNDGVLIHKTVRPASMNGRDVMKRICELSGGFGHITRQNRFKVITLSGLGLYPSETLFPAEDLFPAESAEAIGGFMGGGAAYYPESTYEDYICQSIDQIKIRTNEEDGGVTVNNGTAGRNEYIVQGNFLISDKGKEELTEIAEALFLVVKNRYYRPHNMIVTGLPYLEVGDTILITTRDDVVESFIFTRVLSGIQTLKDTLGATGYEFRQNKIGLDIQISQLEQTASQLQDTTEEIEQEIEEIQEFNGKTEVSLKKLDDSIVAEVKRATSEEEKLSSRVTQTAEEITAEVNRATKAEGELSSRVTQTAEEITSEVSRAKSAESSLSSRIIQTADQLTVEVRRASAAENNLDAKINITAEQVSSKVSKGELASEISQTAEAITLRAGQLIFISDQFTLDENGNASFGGTVDGAIVIAKDALYLRDRLHQDDKQALGANDDSLYIGFGFPEGAVFFYDVLISGNMKCVNANVTSRMTAGIVDAKLITCQAINADSHTHNLSDLNCEETANGNFKLPSGSSNIASVKYVNQKIHELEQQITALQASSS